MENVEIARVLDEVGDLLEIQGANPFKVRAYRNAARVITGHPTSLAQRVAEGGDLAKLPGVGKDIAAYITELVTTGRLGRREALADEVPPTLLALLRLPGVGPRRARQLWRDLGVQTLDDLEAACRDGRVQALHGFGQKTRDRILEAIDRSREAAPRMLLSEADAYARALLEWLGRAPGLEQAAIAGSWRRRKETVGDLDALATARQPQAVMDHFVAWDQLAAVQAAGPTRATARMRSGLQVDLRVVSPESFGAALAYFTGSKAHNIRIRRRAQQRGLRLSEYGLFPRDAEDQARPVAGATEEEVYAAVGLPWIPPELREDQGEVEAAEGSALPRLIEPGELRGDLQMHTTWSDGRDTLEAMVAASERRGYAYIAITDHTPALRMMGVKPEDFRRQWEEIARVQRRHPKVRILRSAEVDILQDGSLDLDDELLAELDYVLVAVHSFFDLPPARQTARLVRALSHPLVHALAHPTGRRIGRRPPIAVDLDEVLACARAHQVALEIDAQPKRLDLPDILARQARDHGVKLVISSDAHAVEQLDWIRYGIDQARRAWLEPDDILNTLPLERFLQVLGRARPAPA